MNVFKCEISNDSIQLAINNLQHSFSATQLAIFLEKEGVPKINGYNYVSIAAASRIIQELKSKGMVKIVYGGGGNTVWQFIEKPKISKSKSRTR